MQAAQISFNFDAHRQISFNHDAHKVPSPIQLFEKFCERGIMFLFR
jgi:hypothetical protein